MAHERLIVDLIGSAIADAIERSQGQSLGRARAAWEWLRQSAAAPPGTMLVTPDGSTGTYTGLVLVERNRAVLMLAFYQPPKASRQPPGPTSCVGCNRHTSLFEDESAPDERNPLYRR